MNYRIRGEFCLCVVPKDRQFQRLNISIMYKLIREGERIDVEVNVEEFIRGAPCLIWLDIYIYIYM